MGPSIGCRTGLSGFSKETSKPGTGWRMLYSQMAYIVNADAPNDAASRSIGMNLRG
jgi:hypothetical protein